MTGKEKYQKFVEIMGELGVVQLARGDVDDQGDKNYGYLQQNAPNESIMVLQTFLGGEGFDIAIDGAFGKDTQDALRAYNARWGIDDDTFNVAVAGSLIANHEYTPDPADGDPDTTEPDTAEEPPTIPDFNRRPTNINLDIINLKQFDARWKNRLVGDTSFGAVGCLATVHSMIASHLLGREVLPPELDEWFDNNAGYQRNLFISGKFKEFLRSLEYPWDINLKRSKETDSIRVDHPDDLNDIVQILETDTPVIMHVSHNKSDEPQHFVLATGYEYDLQTGDPVIYFNDPGAGDHRGNSTKENAHNYGICAYRWWEVPKSNLA